MIIKSIKKYLYIILIIVMFVCFSCTKEKRSEIIREEVVKNDSYIETKNIGVNTEEIKYIINKRSGKVHSYTHGMNCGMSEHNKLESNENIEEILKNENYDICLTCFAGLKLNLEKYRTNKIVNDDDVDLTNKEVNLIKNYMNMYEFGKHDNETQKFLVCIFEVSNWYANNVYTQLGGNKSAREVDDIAEVEASEEAYKKWRNYLTLYGNQYKFDENKKILPVLYPDHPDTDMVVYRCDLFKNAGYGKGNTKYTINDIQIIRNAEKEPIFREYKNYCVVDDSSKFAAAVYYHYINKELLKDEKLEDRIAYGIDLWETKSINFADISDFINKLFKTRNFEIITWDMIEKRDTESGVKLYYFDNEFDLLPGDLLCSKKNYNGNSEGHVEFYIETNKVINWGTVNNEYIVRKKYTPRVEGYLSNDKYGREQMFTTIIRFKGEKDEKE